jgi:AhpD family alkylhydroperoxidase
MMILPENRSFAMYSMSNLKKLKILDANATAAMQAFWAFDKAAMADGAIPAKYKELMALAVAFTTQCPYCIEIHSGKARRAGATDPEIGPAQPSLTAPMHSPKNSRDNNPRPGFLAPFCAFLCIREKGRDRQCSPAARSFPRRDCRFVRRIVRFCAQIAGPPGLAPACPASI